MPGSREKPLLPKGTGHRALSEDLGRLQAPAHVPSWFRRDGLSIVLMTFLSQKRCLRAGDRPSPGLGMDFKAKTAFQWNRSRFMPTRLIHKVRPFSQRTWGFARRFEVLLSDFTSNPPTKLKQQSC